jgi:transcriptional regulator with XRE-family HTH domain
MHMSIKKGHFKVLLGERIAAERKRLGLTQADAADVCEVSRGMWVRYENDKAVMRSDVMARFVGFGADANYILLGTRTEPVDLSRREACLIANYRASPEEAQRSVETMASLLAQPAAGKDVKESG